MEVESEIYRETDFESRKSTNGYIISKFNYMLPYGDDDEADDDIKQSNGLDDDGDFILKRTKKGFIEIEHKKTTGINLVGLQVWRGALLLADYIITNRKQFADNKILEVGSGVGLTSIVAGKYCKEVICTDIDLDEIFRVIHSNIYRNMHLLKTNNIKVMELDFKAEEWPPTLWENIKDVEVVFAADVIYDVYIIEAFVHTIQRLIADLPNLKAIYIALEKRYVFTLDDMNSVAPMFECFVSYIEAVLQKEGLRPSFRMKPVKTDFPQFFDYERVKELVLFQVTKIKYKRRESTSSSCSDSVSK